MFITLDAVSMIMAVQTVGDVARKALLSDEEVVVGMVAVRADGSIRIEVVSFIAVQTMGEILTIQTTNN